jgi:hypothetical protein
MDVQTREIRDAEPRPRTLTILRSRPEGDGRAVLPDGGLRMQCGTQALAFVYTAPAFCNTHLDRSGTSRWRAFCLAMRAPLRRIARRKTGHWADRRK